jgi:hypothetical protein
MTHSLIDTQLDLVEQQIGELSAVLLRGDPHQVHAASATLQRVAVDLLQISEDVRLSSLREGARMQRIHTLANALQPLREGLLRQSAFVERALEIVMPAAQQATYASGTRYGGAVRQSGAFRVLSA